MSSLPTQSFSSNERDKQLTLMPSRMQGVGHTYRAGSIILFRALSPHHGPLMWILPPFLFFLFFFFFFRLFRAAPKAYGRSQARSSITVELIAYTRATAMPDPSLICDLHHSLWQRWILNPLREARDRTYILLDTSLSLLPLSHNGNPHLFKLGKLRSREVK